MSTTNKKRENVLDIIKGRMPGITYDISTYAEICERYIGKKCYYGGRRRGNDGSDDLLIFGTVQGFYAQDNELYITLSTTKPLSGISFQLKSRPDKTWDCSLPNEDIVQAYNGKLVILGIPNG